MTKQNWAPTTNQRLVHAPWRVRPVAGPAARVFWIVEEDGIPFALIPDGPDAARHAYALTLASKCCAYVAKAADRGDPAAARILDPGPGKTCLAKGVRDDDHLAQVDAFLSRSLLVLTVRRVAGGE